MTSPEPIHDLARGDIAVSRQLTKALRVIMDGTTDRQLKSEINKIIEGRASARGLLRSEAFDRVLDQTMPAAIRRFADMSEEERQRLAQQGALQLDRLRVEPDTEPEPPVGPRTGDECAGTSPTNVVHPGTRKPNRERVVTPDEPDDDDEYFAERRDKGWLV